MVWYNGQHMGHNLSPAVHGQLRLQPLITKHGPSYSLPSDLLPTDCSVYSGLQARGWLGWGHLMAPVLAQFGSTPKSVLTLKHTR